MCSEKVVDAIRWPSGSDYSLEKHGAEKSAGSHIVEFGPTLQLVLDEDFSIYGHFHERGFSLKAEGGGTFGLGET
jgi:hypothetical protein